MSSELTVINNAPTSIQQGGLGIDFSSKLFALKPVTINIVQPNSTAEGALKGHLRISETGMQFRDMDVTLLKMPVEQRSYYIGEPGNLNRTPDNLMCFSRDMVEPDRSAKMPQSLKCANCTKADWVPYRKEKAAGRNPGKDLIPPCDAFYYSVFIDTVLKMPMQMYIRSKSKQTFEAGMQNVARTLMMMKSQGQEPNIFDVRFRLSTKLIKTGNFSSYVLDISDAKAITEDQREEFGAIYQQYVNRNNRSLEEEAAAQIDQATASVDSAVLDGDYVGAIEV